ncbi:patatin [Aliidongia dinghuensis]|uniref:Patatin n=1 Tax=Aliidongia dinghuensis TaxID=1867774 RepID=A0A8J2YUE4_9PROT|nr:patatin-like phospholipase family protein [Aliidongia dinghuensis]GGF23547.1 patatin [Aliidongia dinghuensis]
MNHDATKHESGEIIGTHWPVLADLPPLEMLAPRTLAALTPELPWFNLPGGRALFDQGEPADALYIVVSGTLGVVVSTPDGGQQLIATIRSGETIGEMALITGAPHSATIVALRDSELVIMPREIFDRLIAEEPKFLTWLNRLLVDRLHRTTLRTASAAPNAAVAVVPIDRSVPMEELMGALIDRLRRTGKRVHRFGDDMSGQPIEWYDEIERCHDLVLYEARPAEPELDGWSRFCLRQADRIMLVGRPLSRIPDPLPMAPIDKGGRILPIELVLIEPDRAGRRAHPPREPERFTAIHHIRLHEDGDIRRLARHMAGLAVGLVLAGGAARGFAHIGAIRALREVGVPIDRIGGASMGAIVGACVAADWDDDEIADRMHTAFVRSNPLDDYNVPWVSLFRGKSVDRLLQAAFGDTVIEGLWRPFYAVSTNLTRGGMCVHRAGPLWEALRASVAIPGVLPPVLHDGEVLVDGGVIDNFPVDIMAAERKGPIVGIDVAGDRALMPGSEVPLNRHGVIGWFRPDTSPLPGIVSILMRAGTVSSQLQTSIAKTQTALLIEPELTEVPLLDWQSFDRAVEAGYRQTRKVLEQANLSALGLA